VLQQIMQFKPVLFNEVIDKNYNQLLLPLKLRPTLELPKISN